MRADLRAKTRPAFASLRGWASPIGSGANLGLLCAVDRRAPGRGRGLGGEPRMLSARAIACALGLNVAKPNWFSGERASGPRWARSWRREICARPPGLPAARPKAPKRKPAAGPAWGVPVGIPVARNGCRVCARSTPKSFPVLRRLINRGKSPSFGLQAVLAMKAGRMGGAAPRAGRPTGLGDWGRSISSAFYSLRSGARRIGPRSALLSPRSMDSRNAFRFDASPPDAGVRANRIGQGGAEWVRVRPKQMRRRRFKKRPGNRTAVPP